MSDWWKELRKFCRLPELQEYDTEWQQIQILSLSSTSTCSSCTPTKGRQRVLGHNLAMQGHLQISRFPAQWSVWLVRIFVNFMKQRQAHCLQVRQLNDLLSKGYSTCAFLSTNQAHAMPSDSSNNPNGNLVLNSISDTTILLMQNSDRFGWQGRNACF